jgi:hypothetical protein
LDLLSFSYQIVKRKIVPRISLFAGDADNKKTFVLNFEESIPPVEYNDFTEAEWNSIPINIDEDDVFDIRVSITWMTYREVAYEKLFKIGNNFSGLEFAANENDTLSFVQIFNNSDLICENERWLEGENDIYFNL